ncbi:MAG: ABC transporter permease [Acidimicrobiales bacterium]
MTGDVGLLGRQIGWEQRAFWRNPASAVFTFVFPALFLVIFSSTNINSTITSLGPGRINFTQYYVPSIVAFGVMGACFTNLAIALAFRRDSGVLKRVRGTPLPPWAFLGGLIGNAIVVGTLLTIIVIGVGMALYDVTFPGRWVALLGSLAVGAAAFCAMGLATTTFVPNAEAAPAVVNVVFFPLVFISGTFFPIGPRSVMAQIAGVFPVRHFITAVFASFDPRHTGSGLRAGDLAVMAAWGIAGLLIALRRFRWEPGRT